MDISVGKVKLEWPLDVALEDVKVLRPNDSLPQLKDTVADIGKVKADINLKQLLKKKLEVDELDVEDAKINTSSLISDTQVKGKVGKLNLKKNNLDLKGSHLSFDDAKLEDADLSILLSDTAAVDTTSEPSKWKIDVGKMDIKNSDVKIRLPGDSTRINAHLGDAQASGTSLDVGNGEYKIDKVDVKDGAVKYDKPYKAGTKGIDPNHLDMKDVNLGADNFSYGKDGLKAKVRNASLKETKSKTTIKDFKGDVELDDKQLRLKNASLKTPDSNVRADVEMDLNAFDDKNPGQLKADVHGSIGKQDLLKALSDAPADFKKNLPNEPMRVDGKVEGNMQHLKFNNLQINSPNHFNLKATGTADNLLDSKNRKIDADVDLHAKNVDFVKSLLDPETRKSLNIPKNFNFKGHINTDGSCYGSNVNIHEGGGTLKGTVRYCAGDNRYKAHLTANKFPLQHYLPNMDLSAFTGKIDAEGVGTDFLSPKTSATAKVKIQQFKYGDISLNNMDMDATLKNGRAHAIVYSRNPLVKGNLTLDGMLRKGRTCGTVWADLTKVDLKRLNVIDDPLDATVCGHVDICTDWDEYWDVQGLLSDIVVWNNDKQKAYRAEDVVLDILTRRDTTHAIVDCGDFHLDMDAQGGYKRLLKTSDRLLTDIRKQMKERKIDQLSLRENLPTARIKLNSGQNNIFVRSFKYYDCSLNSLNCDLVSSPRDGINGDLQIGSLLVDSILLDTINLALRSDEERTSYEGQIQNFADNPQYTFNALFNGAIYEDGTHLEAKLYDKEDKLGVRMGLAATIEQNGYRLHSYGQDPILGYKKFDINDDNYVFVGNDRRVSADVKLVADDGTGVQIYSDDDNTDALQDITVSLNKFNLEKVLSVIPYTPDIAGILDGDFHLIQTENDISVSSALQVQDMAYEHCPMGNIGTEFVYMPKSDGSHYVDGILTHEGIEVGTLQGTYNSKGDGYLDANLVLNDLPMQIINGFIPNRLFGFEGKAKGEFDVKGALSRPNVNGEAVLDSAYFVSEPYGVRLRFDETPVKIDNSNLTFSDFKMYGYNDSPLVVNGTFNFSNMDHMKTNLRMYAKDFLLINAEENYRSEAYGKAYVNFFGFMQGELDNLSLRGKLDVLGSTDMTYVLRDSPLTTDNQLDELVRFVDFNDTTTVQTVSRPPASGFEMDLQIGIDEGAHIVCALNEDHSNYIDLIGGGDLRLQYDAVEDLRLTGKYTLNSGEMKYSLPIIPLKTFTIQDGSYIDFQGDPMNPHLNITATERTKAAVSTDGGSGRMVAFDCGVVVTKTLNDMGLEFIINAPEDLTVSNQLATMTAEDRGKIAITMLTTGMYLVDGNTSAFSMNSALSAFLQNQINSLAGNALRSLDLSIGVDNSTSASGAMQTDYSFKFAKRLWNNRLNVIVGGKLSSGSDVSSQNQTFFNNVTFEYRLNNTASKYVKLFYERDAYDWLEGDIGKYGAGFVWKRKVQHFSDLFRFKEKQDTPAAPRDSMAVPRDSLKVQPHE